MYESKSLKQEFNDSFSRYHSRHSLFLSLSLMLFLWLYIRPVTYVLKYSAVIAREEGSWRSHSTAFPNHPMLSDGAYGLLGAQ